MLTRQDIIQSLEDYQSHAILAPESGYVARTIDFINHTPKAFERDHAAGGHVGATAVVISEDRTHILLTLHKALNTWILLGSHCDGNWDLPQVAYNRITQDAGPNVAPVCRMQGGILDVDIHDVPAYHRKGDIVPAHLHYDVAYLFTASDTPPVSDVSRWFLMTQAVLLPGRDEQFWRIIDKIKPGFKPS